jgi:tripartite-type tricarboxylate transporter receptor subunit TctC
MVLARACATPILAIFILATGNASAQTYPNRRITMLVPYPPGGATDAIARIIQNSMERSLGQPIVIENVGGVGGMIAASRAARAEPDGYTILIHQVALAAGVSMYPNLTFDTERDFVTIGLINTGASSLVGRPTLPANNFEELLRWMKEPGQTIKIGHAGVGSFSHLAGVLVAQQIGVKVTQVPYRGAGPALVDLLSGEVDLEAQSAIVAGPLVKAGKLNAYAVIGTSRFAGLPGLPTMSELGYKKLDISLWHLLLAPARTPHPVVDKLNTALRDALADAKVQKAFADGGMDEFPPDETTPEAASALLMREITFWGDVVRDNHISGEQ